MRERDTTDRVRIVVIGHGGWRIPWSRRSSVSGYGDGWRAYVADHAVDDGAVIIDLTTVPFRALSVLSISGPMVDTDLPAGMIAPVGGGVVPFAPGGDQRGFLGNTGMFDNVAIDVYTAMAAYVGAAVDLAYRDGVARPGMPPAWLPRRRDRPEGWAPPSVRRWHTTTSARQPDHEGGYADTLAGLLPSGWSLEGDDASDGLLVCPHGHTIEQDGRCPSGCESPLVTQGLL